MSATLQHEMRAERRCNELRAIYSDNEVAQRSEADEYRAVYRSKRTASECPNEAGRKSPEKHFFFSQKNEHN